ncbi:MAG TPA: glycerophosphodiester phosphodiesterase family protein [Devosiaceae bacterium]
MRTIGRIVLLLAALVLPATAFAQTSIEARFAPGQPPVVIAHRSNWGGYPEDSLAAIAYALDLGVDMISVEVQMTGDSQYVLMHDPTLNRTTNVEAVYPQGAPGGPSRQQRAGRDFIRDYTLAEIRKLELTDGTDGGQHRIPTLDEALDLIGSKALVDLNLKMYGTDTLAELLNARDKSNLIFFDILYSDPTVLGDISAATGIRAMIALGDSRDYVSDIDKLAKGLGDRLAMVAVRTQKLTPEVFEKARQLGVWICIAGAVGEDTALYHDNDPEPWRRAANSGANALMTNYPEELLRALGR